MKKNFSMTALPSLLFALLAAGEARALDQTAAQEEAKRLQDQGSDDSLKNSYGNGLKAVNQFFQLNIPGAVTYGVKAYGQYRNSEKLDNMKDQSKQNQHSMSSAGVSGPSASGITGKSEYVSPYGRLDKKFLHEGETAVIAERLEKLSGISRDRMFDIAVETHTNSKALNDPGFFPWFSKTYRDLTAKAPNKDFRDTMNSFGDKLEGLLKTGAAKMVLAQFQEKDAGRVPATMLAKSDEQSGKNSEPEVANAEAKAEVKEEPQPAASPVVVAEARPDPNGLAETPGFSSRGIVGATSANQRPGFDRIQFDAKDKFFVGLVQAADAEKSGPSIFETVSQKIKEVSVRQRLGEKVSVASLSN